MNTSWDMFLPPEMPVIRRVPKEQWLGKPSVPGIAEHQPRRIVLHHSYIPSAAGFSGEASIRGIHTYHTKNKGWSDIGYHFLISPDGSLIFEGRPENQIGAHCGGTPPAGVIRNFGNTGSLGICLIGNYDEERPEVHALYTISILIHSLLEKYNIPPTEVFGHCEAWSKAPKSCPGEHLFTALLGGNRWWAAMG